MSEKPILFSGEMVRAILAGRKTQTRRVAKFVPLEAGLNMSARSLSVGDYCTGAPESGKVLYSMGGACWEQRTKRLFCPYGKPGDRLWVRETFALQCDVDGDPPPFNDGRPLKLTEASDEASEHWTQPHYRATDPQPDLTCPEDSPHHNCGSEDICASPWRPSIFMPRWASRITLEVTAVRVERLQEISEAGARTEGFNLMSGNGITSGVLSAKEAAGVEGSAARRWYANLWNSINGKGSWDQNPFVWVIEFKREAGA